MISQRLTLSRQVLRNPFVIARCENGSLRGLVLILSLGLRHGQGSQLPGSTPWV